MGMLENRLVADAVHSAEQTLGVSPGYSVMHRGRFMYTLTMLQRYVQPGRVVRVADVGVWPGYQSLALETMGYQVTGYDLQPDRLKPMPFPVILQNLNDEPRLRADPQSFEAVVATEILEHLNLDSIPSVLTGIRESLTPNGWLFLTTPNRNSLGSRLRPRAHGTDAAGHGHTKEYTPVELRVLFAEGWKNIHITTFDAYRGVGMVSTKEYYRPLWQWWRHPRKTHNLMKIVLNVIQWLCPPWRDTILVIAQRTSI